MEIPAILESYGLAGFVIAAMAWAIRALWERYNAVQDARLVDLRDGAERHAQLTREVKATLDATLAALREGGR